MAEGLARHYFSDKFIVQSAGSRPSRVNPYAIQVMEEIGIDVSEQYSKSVDEIDPASVDTVITLCNDEVCPLFFGDAERLHWPFEDPASEATSEKTVLAEFRKIRDRILNKLKEWA